MVYNFLIFRSIRLVCFWIEVFIFDLLGGLYRSSCMFYFFVLLGKLSMGFKVDFREDIF